MKEAQFFEKLDQNKVHPVRDRLVNRELVSNRVHCNLCPQSCIIPPDKTGFCRVRKNIRGELYSLIYEEATSISLDPIEKKPLYHYHPKEFILSVGTRGCNLACQFCQNWEIAQVSDAPTQKITPEFIIQEAKRLNSFGIAYTYNEPFIWYEFVYDTAKMARDQGLENVLVTNGFVNKEPLEKILPLIDAMNIDLKSIDELFYEKYCFGRLAPVLETIKLSQKHCHIELTNLVIPTLNDCDENFIGLVNWVYENLGRDVPLHFSRYFPCYKMTLPPTPVETLKRAHQIAKEKLKYVYLGNV
ncbi:MAG: AmmeMemoRadiSam system radical SAM enzyme [Candidatus Omnitrophota bacterium]